ncbi:MAG TPA: hypothetical protein PKX56_00945 [Marmoricola sp.]|nr:hypothetical protein [Marmoricola sp.]HNI70146.1 hypothetical protein [Marmoricola sp.]HNJ77893.1 hypothetical protein [Marmoricola sp.]
MSSQRRPQRSSARGRGRAPSRERPSQGVFWIRRFLVVGTALALSVAVIRFFAANGPAGQPDQATTVSSHAQSSAESPAGVFGPQPVSLPSSAAGAESSAAAEVPPSGPCLDSAITTTPEVTEAVAGGPITINLQLTGTVPACSFKTGPKTLAIKITSGRDSIWSSMDCPRAIPEREVVVRAGTPTVVPVRWSGRRSDPECSKQGAWALPGFYHVQAATLGSDPSDLQFEVTAPGPKVIVKTVKPKPNPMPDGQPPRVLPEPLD